jgi:hypothetical protein
MGDCIAASQHPAGHKPHPFNASPACFLAPHLLLQRRVERGLHEEDVGGGGEVDADGAAAHAQQEHRGGRVLHTETRIGGLESISTAASR